MSSTSALDYDEEYVSQMRVLEEEEVRGGSPVQRSFEDAVVFVTGGTGFLGKQLIEKLFRSCWGIKKLYILIRSKRGKSMQERLDNIFKDPVFEVVRRRFPDFQQKVVPVEGEIAELGIGLSNIDYGILTGEVTHIFHVAATVNFDEPLRPAVLTNVRGTREVLTLARNCPNLKAIVHVSTAYTFCPGREGQDVFEKCYDVPITPEALIQLVESLDEERLDAITPGLLLEFRNTYMFTKAVSEVLINTTAKDLPICIIRPAIVVPSYREPIPGWLNHGNVFGTSGIYLGSGIGAVHTVLANVSLKTDIVTVDLVNNLAIAAAWDTAVNKRVGVEAKIYTLSGFRNCMTWGDYVKGLQAHAYMKLESPKMVWTAYCVTTTYVWLFKIYTLFLHFIPALLVDLILTVIGKKPMALIIYKKIYRLNMVQSYYSYHVWNLRDENTVSLIKKLSQSDRIIFQFDMAKIDLWKFTKTWWIGLRKFIIKDGLRETEIGVRKQKIFFCLNVVFGLLYGWLLFKVFMVFGKTFLFVLSRFCNTMLCE